MRFVLAVPQGHREGNVNPLQYSCPENPMDGRAWQATILGIAKGRARLSDFSFTFKDTDKKIRPVRWVL